MLTSLFEGSDNGLYFCFPSDIDRTINLSFIRIHCRMCARTVADRIGVSMMLKTLRFQRRLRWGNGNVKGAAF